MSGLAVVVGGGRGIGRAVACELAGDEAVSALVVADIDLEMAQETAALASVDTDATAVHVDLSDPASVERLFEQTRDADRVAIVAAVFTTTPTLELSREEFERVLRVNAVGCFHVAQLYAGAMAAAGGGAVVGIASIAARMPRMRQAAYAASKAAMRQALRVLAMEVAGDGVRINTVSPGPTDTPMMRQLASDHRSVDDLAEGSAAALRPRIPAGRVATPEDVAAAVRFMLSPAAAHIVMQDLVVDGGELLGM
jgi:2,3-dihydro-2,3-dihydroxybenzoate dehydrogenase